MNSEQALAVFENYKIRRVYDEASEMWFFSVVDVVAALIQQPDYQTARKYWNKLKERLKNEGSQSVTNCHQLKMVAEDGKMRATDAASPETLLRIIQSVPSPRAEPIKLWLAKVGYERIQDMSDPARSLDRARGHCCLPRIYGFNAGRPRSGTAAIGTGDSGSVGVVKVGRNYASGRRAKEGGRIWKSGLRRFEEGQQFSLGPRTAWQRTNPLGRFSNFNGRDASPRRPQCQASCQNENCWKKI